MKDAVEDFLYGITDELSPRRGSGTISTQGVYHFSLTRSSKETVEEFLIPDFLSPTPNINKLFGDNSIFPEFGDWGDELE